MDNSCEVPAVPVFNVKQTSLFCFITCFYKEHKNTQTQTICKQEIQ